MKKLIVIIALLFGSPLCLADGWTGPLTIASATTENSDMIMIYTSDGGGLFS
jgi:hypothetical protein